MRKPNEHKQQRGARVVALLDYANGYIQLLPVRPLQPPCLELAVIARLRARAQKDTNERTYERLF
jgi:hypothetical protein